MTTAPGRINYTRTMLHGTSLKEFDEIALVGNSTDSNIKHITKGLLEYPPPLNALSKERRTMRCAMRKTHDMLFKRLAAQLM